MFATRLPPVYDKLLDFLVEKVTPQQMLTFEASPEEQKRADELTQKNKAGRLTPEEAEELRLLLETDLLIMGLKSRAMIAMNKK